MTRSTRRIGLAVAVFGPVSRVGLAPADARAALRVTRDFTGQPGGRTSTPATFPAAGVISSPIVRGPGLVAEAGVSSMNSGGFTAATTPDPGDYYESIVGPSGAAPAVAGHPRIHLATAVVPEPSTLAPGGIGGLLGLGVAMRRGRAA